jgi:hypothetical protein
MPALPRFKHAHHEGIVANPWADRFDGAPRDGTKALGSRAANGGSVELGPVIGVVLMRRPGVFPTVLAALAAAIATAAVPPSGAAPALSDPESVTLAAAEAAPAASSLPPMPGEPQDPDPGMMGGATWSISPLVVHPGDSFTLKTRTTSASGFSIPDPSPGAYAASPRCVHSGSGAGAGSTCTYPVVQPEYFQQPYWIRTEVWFTPIPQRGCDTGSCDMTVARRYVAVVAGGTSVLSGVLTDANGAGVGGVAMAVRGGGTSRTVRTSATGAYTTVLPLGTYTVTPTGNWDPPARSVRLRSGGTAADFRAAVAELDFAIEGSRLVNGLDWSTAPATGLAWRSGTVRAHTASGAPLADQVVQIDAPYLDGSAPGSRPAPRIAVCDAGTYRPLFTTGDRAERISDAGGTVGFTLMLGSEPSTSLFHARLRDDVTALDVERIGLTGAVTGPAAEDITRPMQNATALGLPAPPLFALSAASLQAGLVEWWLGYRSGDQVGADRMLSAGDFVPVRTADNARGAIVFYPAGNPGPLREHLVSGTPLPADYATVTLGFRQVPFDVHGNLFQFQVRLDGLPSLPAWEAENGPATDGFLLAGTGLGTSGWLGGPLPPGVVQRSARVAYARCVPGALPPVTVVEVHSPVRLSLPDGSGGFALPAASGTPATYVIPTGSAQQLALAGTGSGTATIVVRVGGTVRAYALHPRRGAAGTLQLNAAGAATRLVFAGRTVTATQGVTLRVTGLPRELKAGTRRSATVRVRDGFGDPAALAQVVARGAGVFARGRTRASGIARIVLRPDTRGSVVVMVTTPGARASRTRIPVR